MNADLCSNNKDDFHNFCFPLLPPKDFLPHAECEKGNKIAAKGEPKASWEGSVSHEADISCYSFWYKLC